MIDRSASLKTLFDKHCCKYSQAIKHGEECNKKKSSKQWLIILSVLNIIRETIFQTIKYGKESKIKLICKHSLIVWPGL